MRFFFVLLAPLLILELLGVAVGCGTVPTPDPVTPTQLTVDCGVPSTRAQMAEAMPILSRCIQAETAVVSCVASLQTSYTLDALLCAERSRGMAAYRATAEGTAGPGEQHEATAIRDHLRDEQQSGRLRFKY